MSQTTKLFGGALGAIALGGVAAAFLPAIGVGAAFLVAGTSLLQGVGEVAQYDQNVANEVNRQKSICDQIDFTKKQEAELDKLLSDVRNAKMTQQDTRTRLMTLGDTIQAELKKIQDLKNSHKTKMYIQIVINIFIFVVISYILFQSSTPPQ